MPSTAPAAASSVAPSTQYDPPSRHWASSSSTLSTSDTSAYRRRWLSRTSSGLPPRSAGVSKQGNREVNGSRRRQRQRRRRQQAAAGEQGDLAPSLAHWQPGIAPVSSVERQAQLAWTAIASKRRCMAGGWGAAAVPPACITFSEEVDVQHGCRRPLPTASAAARGSLTALQAGENTRSMRGTECADRSVQWRRPAGRPSWKVAGTAWTGATLMRLLAQPP